MNTRRSLIRLLAAGLLFLASFHRASAAEPREAVDEAAIRQKFMQIVIPKVEFREATVTDALDFLKQKCLELDPKRGGLSFVIKLPPAPLRPVAPIPGLVDPNAPIPLIPAVRELAPDPERITLMLTNIPLWDALRYTAEVAHLQMKWQEYGLLFSPPEAPAGKGKTPPPAGTRAAVPPDAPFTGKLRRLVIPKLDFREASLWEGIFFVKQKAISLDQAEPDLAARGINIVYVPRPESEHAPEPPPLTLKLENAPIGEVLRTFAQMANLDLAVEEYAVVLRARPRP